MGVLGVGAELQGQLTGQAGDALGVGEVDPARQRPPGERAVHRAGVDEAQAEPARPRPAATLDFPEPDGPSIATTSGRELFAGTRNLRQGRGWTCLGYPPPADRLPHAWRALADAPASGLQRSPDTPSVSRTKVAQSLGVELPPTLSKGR